MKETQDEHASRFGGVFAQTGVFAHSAKLLPDLEQLAHIRTGQAHVRGVVVHGGERFLAAAERASRV